MADAEIHCPAKLNLFLAITGRRADGFHDLVSVATPLDWGDTLTVNLRGAGEGFALMCDDPAVPVDGTNLVLRAAETFRAATGWAKGAQFILQKRIPMGAGLGGGSSNGAMALRALNHLAGEPLGAPALEELAAKLGSDCALFLRGGPVVMRGRGERVEPLPAAGAARLRGRRVLVFKPGFGIATPWAYGRMVAGAPGSYLPAPEAEARLAGWLGDAAAPAERLLYNNMEGAAFAKYLALPTLLGVLRRRFGLEARMSGSGSACFALLPEDAPVAEIEAAVRGAWGASALCVAAKLQ
ncbi:MAG: 4-(cytidine 5'-diphospho)-2-C-methyl-D-erythritol kinase [Verrucomicrobia bacterium]|nr:4-(cytidine 5'-diphospho)-2-C-methyl-D-erythritol kinase [Verrucomicrobiota bacterium]